MAEGNETNTIVIEAGAMTISNVTVANGRIESIGNEILALSESYTPEDYNKESAIRLRWTTVPGKGFTGPDDPQFSTFIINFQTNEMNRENPDGKVDEETLAALWSVVKTEGPESPDEKKELSNYISEKIELIDFGISKTEQNIMDAIIEQSRATIRKNWGALNPIFDKIRNDWFYQTIVIHHLGNMCGNRPQDLEIFHMVEKRCSDIGYHYLVSQAGEVFEGRQLLKRGAHTEFSNIGKIGICALGDFHHQVIDPSDDEPTEELIGGIINLINIILQNIPSITFLGGHRDFKNSECPGDVLYERLPDIRMATGLKEPS